jgi:nicotinate phosphoribosyltransferase
MAHSFIQAHDSEAAAFLEFAKSRPDQLTLLIDTYDTAEGARKVVALAPRLKAQGIAIGSVRLDSGDLAALASEVRAILDAGGLRHVHIFASGGLDEAEIRDLLAAGAPIDGFGIGTSLTTSSDAPALDCAYKLEEYAGIARRKRSAGKETWPGRKQVWRRFDAAGRMAGDVLGLEGERQEGTPLLVPIMRGGTRVAPLPAMAELRRRAAASLAALPDSLRTLSPAPSYEVAVTPALRALAAECDRRIG